MSGGGRGLPGGAPDPRREVDDEVEDYLERRARELVAEGMAPDEARRAAEAAFGDVDGVRRACVRIQGRLQRRRRLLATVRGVAGGLAQDLRVGARALLRRPGFASVAVLTLGLGVGANTALFSVVDAVLLRPLPYPEPDRLVQLWEQSPGQRSPSPADFMDLRRSTTTLSDLAAYSAVTATLTGEGEPEEATYASVSANFFRTFGVRAAVGATFGPEPVEAGVRLAVLSDALWARRFGRDPSVVGSTLRVDEVAYSVLGVMPPSFGFPADVAFWVAAPGDVPGSPFLPDPAPVLRDVWYHDVVGRVARGVTLSRAGEEMNALAAGLAAAFPDQDDGLSVRLVPLRDELLGSTGRTLWLLLGATSLVLLVACTNAANLLLARGVARRDELALRTALGAGRARLFTHAVAEAAVIAAAGGVAGAAMAAGGLALLTPWVAAVLPRGGEVSLDGSILLYAMLAAAVTAVLFGTLPARAAVRVAGAARGSRGATGARGHRVLGDALVAAEVAMAVVLVLGAGLLLRSVARVASVDLGFEPEDLTVAWVGLPGSRGLAREERVAFYREVGERLGALPGVRGIAWAQTSPVRGGAGAGLRIEDAPLAPGEDPPNARWNVVSPGYFEVAGVRLVAGRAFTASDDEAAPPVAVVNQALARRAFGGELPIGRRINTGLDGHTPDGGWRWVTVVGVVEDTRNQGPTAEVEPMLFRPITQAGPSSGRMMALVRGGAGTGPAPLLRRAVWSVRADAPVSGIGAASSLAGAFAGERGLVLRLLGAFAALALGLGAVGTYGVTSFAVSRRTRELGVRMALGARRGSVSAMVLREALGPVGVGVLVGTAGGAALSGLLRALLFEVTPLDPATFAAVPLVLLAVSVAAVWIPARRAARVDPVVSLRAE